MKSSRPAGGHSRAAVTRSWTTRRRSDGCIRSVRHCTQFEKGGAAVHEHLVPWRTFRSRASRVRLTLRSDVRADGIARPEQIHRRWLTASTELLTMQVWVPDQNENASPMRLSRCGRERGWLVPMHPGRPTWRPTWRPTLTPTIRRGQRGRRDGTGPRIIPTGGHDIIFGWRIRIGERRTRDNAFPERSRLASWVSGYSPLHGGCGAHCGEINRIQLQRRLTRASRITTNARPAIATSPAGGHPGCSVEWAPSWLGATRQPVSPLGRTLATAD